MAEFSTGCLRLQLTMAEFSAGNLPNCSISHDLFSDITADEGRFATLPEEA